MEIILNEEMSKAPDNKACADTTETTANVQSSTENINADKGERMFTESELEAIVRERLKRDRRVNEELMSVKKLLCQAGEDGLIGGDSYAEKLKSLEEVLESIRASKGTDKENAQEPGKTDGTLPAAEGNGETNAADGGEKEAEVEMSFFGVLERLKQKYPSADELLSGEGLSRFAMGRSGSAEEIFDAYHEFMSCIGRGENDGAKNHAALSSTAFSPTSPRDVSSYALTRQQMEMAKSEGLSYREYAHLLKSIPKGTRKTV